ncbi:chemotaxis protein CheB [Flavobacterium beibuense]|uniref:protein-glutamate methylesterase n=1 Tax=Flavobacterium beibuense F44-8 TaxID=1406840 RepID=A0A0A2LSP1_9FLAO|nr:chemotaxis protein CheB [Flavobacterium beibuense]KGO79160.1 chemotaxis protein CheB [Flavobacterium beibuense F44-8]
MEESKIISGCKALLIGGSAGSLEVLIEVLPKLEQLKSFALIIVLHRKSGEDNLLENLISIKTAIPIMEVEDKVPVEPGYIYIAPSDYHLLFEKDETISLDTSEKVNYSRPSIDVAFESAADVYGPSLAAILLSGANADGTAGLQAIKEAGGVTVVQKPESAEVAYMPGYAIENMSPDLVLDIRQILEFVKNINTSK